ncbi:MAG: hypothetical protein ACK41T_00950 [Pseudobdellovibrio sp.]
MRTWYFIAVFGYSSFVLANMGLAVDKLNALQASIATATQKRLQISCTDVIHQNKTCSFEQMCNKFESAANSLYLYQDSNGYKVPNLALLSRINISKSCVFDGLVQDTIRNPFLFPKQFLDEKSAGSAKNLAENKKTIQTASIRTEKIFKDLKTRIILFLVSQKNSSNSAEINNMIIRINRVKLQPINVNGTYKDLVAQGCDQPNAIFRGDKQTISVCPQLMGYPEGALYTLIGHELGHSIDPCNTTTRILDDETVKFPWMNAESKVEKFKILPIDVRKNPFKSVISCLQSSKSMAISIPSQKELISIYNKRIIEGDNAKNGFSSVTKEGYKKSLNASQNHYPEAMNCRHVTGNGHLQESFSDWVAAQAVESVLKDLKLRKPSYSNEFALSSQGVLIGLGCENIKKKINEMYSKSLKGTSCDIPNSSVKSDGHDHGYVYSSHPETRDRVNKIYLNQPAISSALGCKSDGQNIQNTKKCP